MSGVIKTNFWGTVNGSLVAVEHLRRRGGALINVGSIASDLAFPFRVYAASKHAVKGFTDTLRMELIAEGAPVSVTLVQAGLDRYAAAGRARNYMDCEPTLPPRSTLQGRYAMPSCTRRASAARHLRCGGGKLFVMGKEFAPGAYDEAGAGPSSALQKRARPPENPEGALHEPRGAGRSGVKRRSMFSGPAPIRVQVCIRWRRRAWLPVSPRWRP